MKYISLVWKLEPFHLFLLPHQRHLSPQQRSFITIRNVGGYVTQTQTMHTYSKAYPMMQRAKSLSPDFHCTLNESYCVGLLPCLSIQWSIWALSCAQLQAGWQPSGTHSMWLHFGWRLHQFIQHQRKLEESDFRPSGSGFVWDKTWVREVPLRQLCQFQLNIWDLGVG